MSSVVFFIHLFFVFWTFHEVVNAQIPFSEVEQSTLYAQLQIDKNTTVTVLARNDTVNRHAQNVPPNTPHVSKNTSSDSELFKQLNSLGYLSGSVPPPQQTNVTIYDRKASFKGYNYYVSGNGPEAFLISMEGRVLHSWKYSLDKAFPDYLKKDFPRQRHNKTTHVHGVSFWRKAYLYPNGDLLAIFDGVGIIKIDKESHLLWKNNNRAHHDLQVMSNGNIYILTRKPRMMPQYNSKKAIFDDYVTLLDSHGKEIWSFSIFHCFVKAGLTDKLKIRKKSGDLLHTNSIKILDGKIESLGSAFKKGNILVSMRNVDMVAIIDPAEKKIVWTFQGSFKKQHDAKILDNGHLMLFDNEGLRQKSRVLEFDLSDNSLVWTYRSLGGTSFYSATCGTAERLPNGNTLICESDTGRVFEVRQDNSIVWEFYNPHLAGDKNQYIAAIFDMVRVPLDFPLEWTQFSPHESAETINPQIGQKADLKSERIENENHTTNIHTWGKGFIAKEVLLWIIISVAVAILLYFFIRYFFF